MAKQKDKQKKLAMTGVQQTILSDYKEMREMMDEAVTTLHGLHAMMVELRDRAADHKEALKEEFQG